MVIPISRDIESALADAARKQGTTPESLALQCLREHFISAPAVKSAAEDQGTLADFLVEHIGVLSSGELVPGGAQMSQTTAEKFAAGLAKKRSQGRL